MSETYPNCPDCGNRAVCPRCGETATYQTPDKTFWDFNAHYWRCACFGKSLVEKIAAAKSGLTTHEENVDLLIRLAQTQGAKAMKKKMEARDAEIRKLLGNMEHAKIYREGARQDHQLFPDTGDECLVCQILALLDGQPEEGKRG